MASVLALKQPRERLQRPSGGCNGPLAAAATVTSLKPKNWPDKAISTILYSFISFPGSCSGRFSGCSGLLEAASGLLEAATGLLEAAVPALKPKKMA